jgi:hypothetical protein
MNEFWGKIGFGAKKKLILGQKRINFGVVKNNVLSSIISAFFPTINYIITRKSLSPHLIYKFKIFRLLLIKI